MKIKTTAFALIVLFLSTSCSKDTVAPIAEPEPVEEPTPTPTPTPVASAVAAAAFYENTANFELYIYRFDETEQAWTKRIRSHFPVISETDPTYLGFRNIYVENSGINLFQMTTIYKDVLPSTNIKTVGINVDKVFRFFPEVITGSTVEAKKGTVEVLAQKVKMYTKGKIDERETMEFIEIGISGEGTYDLETGVIDVNVHFDNTAIGGAEKVTHKFKFSKTALTL